MFEKLFSPIKIKRMEMKNRVILPAMGTKFAGKASYVTPQLVNYHLARVKGGCGPIPSYPVASTIGRTNMADLLKTAPGSLWSVSVPSVPISRRTCRFL